MWSLLISASFLLQFGSSLAKQNTPQENFEKMLSLREEHGVVITVDMEIFQKYVKSKHSKYSVVAMFTAMDPKYRCEICQDAKDEYFTLASSYAAMQSSSHIFFVMLDFADVPDAFTTMKLSHAPEFFYFPAGRARKKISDTFGSRKSDVRAAEIAQWLSNVDGIKIKIRRPIDYTKFVIPGVAILVFCVLFCIKPELMMSVIGNTTLWGLAILFVVFLMTSGQVWNSIRKPLDMGQNRRGEMQYILSSSQGQFKFESYIIAAVNFAISFGFILLSAVKGVENRFIKKATGLFGAGVVVVSFGLLISIFRMKHRGYPYLLLFK